MRNIPGALEFRLYDEATLLHCLNSDQVAGWPAVEFKYWDPCDNTFTSHEDYDEVSDPTPMRDGLTLYEGDDFWERCLNRSLDRSFRETFNV